MAEPHPGSDAPQAEVAAGDSMPFPSDRRQIWLEISVVLCIGVLPFLWSAIESLLIHVPDGPRRRTPEVASLGQIIYGVCTLIPVIWIMSRSGHRLRDFGFRAWSWRLDPALILLTILIYLIMWVSSGTLLAFLYTFPFIPELFELLNVPPERNSSVLPNPHTKLAWALALIDLFVLALAEEVVCRGYLITRLQHVLKSTVAALLLSSACFASYHLYQGAAATFNIFFIGIGYGLLFLATRRVLPIAIGHALTNLYLLCIYGPNA